MKKKYIAATTEVVLIENTGVLMASAKSLMEGDIISGGDYGSPADRAL